MFVNLVFQFRLFETHSLKEKRRVLKPVLHKLMKQFSVSATEIGCQGLWQSAEIGVAFVVSDGKLADRYVQKICGFLDESSDFEIVKMERF